MPETLIFVDTWTPPHPASPLAGQVLAETLDGGQCFRWNRTSAHAWAGISGDCAATLTEAGGKLRARIEAGSPELLAHHLADDEDWSELADRLPGSTDAHIDRCRREFPGLRILRQPVGEALLCFLCSATKQIVQIKQMVEILATRFGRELAPGRNALPAWGKLAGISETELRACKLGFRARHVRRVAEFLARHEGWLDETAALPYRQAKERLLILPGVGEKVADCVLLFGAGRFEAFPVDVWILRAMQRHYGLADLPLRHVAQFGRAHFGPLAGLAQQYLFAWERRHRAANGGIPTQKSGVVPLGLPRERTS